MTTASGAPSPVPALPQGLVEAIEHAGYYPALVADSIAEALAGEEVDAHLVHHEATFADDELRRHVTVLALTPTRLVAAHTDEHPADATCPVPYAVTGVETVPLRRIDSVIVSRTVADPANYRPGTTPRDVVVTVGWGSISRLDLEPATCGDPGCEADHGYTGTTTSDDLSVRVSEAGDGAEIVMQALEFAAALSAATVGSGGRRPTAGSPARA
jgi:hypothetical protein